MSLRDFVPVTRAEPGSEPGRDGDSTPSVTRYLHLMFHPPRPVSRSPSCGLLRIGRRHRAERVGGAVSGSDPPFAVVRSAHLCLCRHTSCSPSAGVAPGGDDPCGKARRSDRRRRMFRRPLQATDLSRLERCQGRVVVRPVDLLAQERALGLHDLPRATTVAARVGLLGLRADGVGGGLFRQLPVDPSSEHLDRDERRQPACPIPTRRDSRRRGGFEGGAAGPPLASPYGRSARKRA